MTIDNLIDALLRLRREGMGNVPILQEDSSGIDCLIPINADGNGPTNNEEAVCVSVMAVF